MGRTCRGCVVALDASAVAESEEPCRRGPTVAAWALWLCECGRAPRSKPSPRLTGEVSR
jgi:hypothetical protein